MISINTFAKTAVVVLVVIYACTHIQALSDLTGIPMAN